MPPSSPPRQEHKAKRRRGLWAPCLERDTITLAQGDQAAWESKSLQAVWHPRIPLPPPDSQPSPMTGSTGCPTIRGCRSPQSANPGTPPRAHAASFAQTSLEASLTLEWSPHKTSRCPRSPGPRIAETCGWHLLRAWLRSGRHKPPSRRAEQTHDHTQDASPGRQARGTPLTPKNPSNAALSHAREIAPEVARERVARGEEEPAWRRFGQTRLLRGPCIPNR